jgi:hypothetical protein
MGRSERLPRDPRLPYRGRMSSRFVSTDDPEPSPFGTGYIARLPGAASLPARCNP